MYISWVLNLRFQYTQNIKYEPKINIILILIVPLERDTNNHVNITNEKNEKNSALMLMSGTFYHSYPQNEDEKNLRSCDIKFRPHCKLKETNNTDQYFKISFFSYSGQNNIILLFSNLPCISFVYSGI